MIYLDLLGKEFLYGACGPDAYDCKGLIVELLKREGYTLPAYDSPTDPETQSMRFMERLAIHTEQIDKPEAGCLVMFRIVPRFVSHIGMMLDAYRFIHITKGTRVSVERIDSITWERKVAGFYRMKK